MNNGRTLSNEKFLENLKENQPIIFSRILEFIDEYEKNSVKIRIRDEFGILLVRPSGLLKGCFPSIASALDKDSYFSNKATKIHNGKFDYSKLKYQGASKKITVICPTHGEFQQFPHDHLKGYGCQKCARIANSNKAILKRYSFYMNRDTEKYYDRYIVANISRILRRKCNEWIKRTKENYNNICDITGDSNVEVHHLNNFNRIVRKSIIRTGLSEILINKMISNNDIYLIVEDCVVSDDFNELGVCLRKDIHRLFHKIYGNHGNKEDYYEFRALYKNGVFDNIKPK